MNLLIAKIKKKSSHYKILSDQTIYQFDLDQFSLVDYSPDHNLDEDCLFKVSNFSNQTYCLEMLKNGFISSSFDQIPLAKFKEISYLCSFQEDAVYFQKVTPSTYLNRKILKFGENAKIEECVNKIFINPFPDAVYVQSQNILVFRNLATISSIFKGIDILYKEATQEKVESFLSESFINLLDGYSATKVSKPNRKRIALAMDSLERLEVHEKDQMLDYIHEYCTDITYNNSDKCFSISTDDELKFLLYGIEQRFYTTMLGQEKRLANSIQTLG